MKPRWISHKLTSLSSPLFFPLFSRFTTLITSPNPTSNLTSVLSHIQISRLLSNCGKQGNLHLGSSLHALIIKKYNYYDPRSYDDARTRSAIVVWNSLLFMYAKCRVVWDAVKVFDEMPQRDAVSWNSIISCFLGSGEFEMGFKYFKQIVGLGIDKLDQATFTTVLSACDGWGRVNEMMHGLVILSGYGREVTVCNALITAYFKHGCFGFGMRVFDEMAERNVVTWTAVMSGLVQNGLYDEGLKLFAKMRYELVEPNSLTYLSLLSACSGLQALRSGKQIHALVLKLGTHSDMFIESALMDMYSKCGAMEEAMQIFSSADNLDDVSMTVILAGFAQNGLEEEAIQVFVKMVSSGTNIDPNMVSAILGVFGSDTSSMSFGQQIHSLVIKKRFSANTYVSNGLINMYSKCGTLEDSIKVFHRMPQRNSVSWNSIIAAFARHGDGLKAIQLYELMLSDNIEPTDVTFLSLLHACSHVGLVDKGLEFFDSMEKTHQIPPKMEHYACVVDMLGRAGLLSEAKTFIDQLPVKPGILVWQALLGACAIRGDSELGKYAAQQLLQLDPESAGPYVQLANMFSSEGKWRDRAAAMKRMKEAGLVKETGVSWIEIEKKVHSFVVCDRMHPDAERIYSVLGQMFPQLVDQGYKPDKRFILFYLDQDEEGMLGSKQCLVV